MADHDKKLRFSSHRLLGGQADEDPVPSRPATTGADSPAPSTSSAPSSSTLRHHAGGVSAHTPQSNGKAKAKATRQVPKSDESTGEATDDASENVSPKNGPSEIDPSINGSSMDDSSMNDPPKIKGKGKGRATEELPKNDGRARGRDGYADEDLPDPLLFLEHTTKDRQQALETVDEGISHLHNAKYNVDNLLRQTKEQIRAFERKEEIDQELMLLRAFIADSRGKLGIPQDEKLVDGVTYHDRPEYQARAIANMQANPKLRQDFNPDDYNAYPAEYPAEKNTDEEKPDEKKKKKRKRGGKKVKARNNKGKQRAETQQDEATAADAPSDTDSDFVADAAAAAAFAAETFSGPVPAESSAAGAAREAALGVQREAANSQISFGDIIPGPEAERPASLASTSKQLQSGSSQPSLSTSPSPSPVASPSPISSQFFYDDDDDDDDDDAPAMDPVSLSVYETAAQRLRDVMAETEEALDTETARLARLLRAERKRFQGRVRGYDGFGDGTEQFAVAETDRERLTESLLAFSMEINGALERMAGVMEPVVQHVVVMEEAGERVRMVSAGVGVVVDGGEEVEEEEEEEEEELLAPPARRFGRLGRLATRSMADLGAGLLGRSGQKTPEGRGGSVDDSGL